MTTLPEIKDVLVGPCQVCDLVKRKLHLCSRFHKTCDDCRELRDKKVPDAPDQSRPATKRLKFSFGIMREKSSEDPEIFCKTCDRQVEAALVTLPPTMLKPDAAYAAKLAKAIERSRAIEENFDETGSDKIICKDSYSSGDYDSRRSLDNMRTALKNTQSELKLTRELLDKVSLKTEKHERDLRDLDMVPGGFTFIYFDFASVLKQKEVRIKERNCDIPFTLMVRMQTVEQVPHLGFSLGLEKSEGRAHSPLKKRIVLRAHNASGEVIEERTFATFEEGQCVSKCFDSREPSDGAPYGYSKFLKGDRILGPDVLRDGQLCLSFKVKPLD